MPQGLKVIDLKCSDGQWDEEMIRCLFNEEDSKLILSLSCVDYQIEDKLLWHFTKNGEYSVRSGYYAALAHNSVPETSKTVNTSALWKTLWDLRVANKIKHFLWKLSNQWLPTNDFIVLQESQEI